MVVKERDTAYYIDKARELAALVAENTHRINEQRKIPTDVSNEIADAGFFRLLMPRNLGGAQLDHPTFCGLCRCSRRLTAAWLVDEPEQCLRNELHAHERQDARRDIQQSRAVITNGPPMSRSRAIEVDGGYSLSGRWNFSSGSDHATWIAALTPIVSADDGAELGGCAAVKPRQSTGR